MMLCGARGYTDILKNLIEELNLDPNQADDGGWTALIYSARNGHIESMVYLIEEVKADVNMVTDEGNNVAMSLYGDHPLVIRIIIENS